MWLSAVYGNDPTPTPAAKQEGFRSWMEANPFPTHSVRRDSGLVQTGFPENTVGPNTAKGQPGLPLVMPARNHPDRFPPASKSPAVFPLACRPDGTVVYRFVPGLNQISWLPAAWRSNSKPQSFSFRAISLYRNRARPHSCGDYDRVVSPFTWSADSELRRARVESESVSEQHHVRCRAPRQRSDPARRGR